MKKTLITIFSVMMMTIAAAEENPFFRPFDTSHGTAPFNEIKITHYEPAFEKAMAEHQAEIDRIAANAAAPTFANTIEAMEYAGEMMNRVSSVFFNLLGTESNDEMMAISQRLSPKLSEHANNINLNEELFKRVKAVYDARHTPGLTSEQIRLVEKYYEGFENSGATLSPEDKEKYRALSMELSMATLGFGQNNLRETNAYEMLLTDEADLAGLPASLTEAAAAKAKAKGKEGWLIDLSAPSYIGFMKYATRRDLREKLYRAYNTKGMKGGGYDNREHVAKIVNLRLEIARLLGYKSYSDYVLKNRMAKNAGGVFGLLNRLAEAFAPVARDEVKEVQQFAFHYETGEKMPDALLQKIVDAANYNVGYATLRQLSFGYLDMAWHSLTEPFIGDVRSFEQEAMARVQLLPVVADACMSTSFGHIFSGGYAAGYYSYKWAEVMDADAFSLFKENGIFNKATADSFRRNILERGNTEEPMELYKRFRGREASVDALLRRSGVQ